MASDRIIFRTNVIYILIINCKSVQDKYLFYVLYLIVYENKINTLLCFVASEFGVSVSTTLLVKMR